MGGMDYTMKWTENQLEAIERNNRNILVAAAAGSGKTAVLVERIIQKILVQNVDIDKLLVVTFTNAAASEIRQRVLEAIYKKLEDEPGNENLQRQIILLNKSNISTIHAFCLNVIKNNFFEIGISPDFRIGDTSELELLKLETLDEVFDVLYEEKDSDFIKLTEIYTGYRGDEKLKELVLKIYDFIQSSPFPEEWLEDNIKKFDLSEQLQEDFSKTEWGKIILDEIGENIERNIVELRAVLSELERDVDLEKYSEVVLLDIEEYERALKSLRSWECAYLNLFDLEFKRWPTNKKIQSEIKDKAKVIRTNINTTFKDLVKKIMVADSENANKDIYEMYKVLQCLQKVILKFIQTFKSKKQNKNIIDFGDIEHYALEILVKKDKETNTYVPTEVAKRYSGKFQEIAIDEYQDSNSVQECVLSAISNGHNMFMVGDVKQSIYRFRQARPELFLEKYNRFKLKDELQDVVTEVGTTQNINQKIQLFNNFRSRELVLEFANLVFKNIMTKKVGDIDYTREEYLNFTALFENPENNNIKYVDNCKETIKTNCNSLEGDNIKYAGKMSMEIIDTCDLENTEDEEEEENKSGFVADEEGDDEATTTNQVEDIQENLEKLEIEARYVAFRIKEIIDSKYMVWDKEIKKYRSATYKDFVILLRSTSSVATIFEKELFKLNMPAFSDGSQKYLESLEIETILNLLKIIDNPMQDIPLVSVLRSYIGGFTDNEMLEIRLNNIQASFYESMMSFVSDDEKKQMEECTNGEKEYIENETLNTTGSELPNNLLGNQYNSEKSDNVITEKQKLKSKVISFLSKLENWQNVVKFMPLDEFIWQLYIDTGYYNYVSMMNDGGLRIANLKMLFERAKQYESASFKGLYNFIRFIDKLKKNGNDLEDAKLIGENDNVIRIMSIHKSKGLEFPIVFLSTTGKKFNLRDLNDNILLHQDLGIGPKYINYERKIEYSTLAREALKIKLKNDSLSEEMRVLYVALTRPKERLIVTGIAKNAKKKFEEKRVLLEASKNSNVNVSLLKKYTSYLDWLELAYLNDINNMENSVKFDIFNLNEILDKYEAFNKEEKLESNTDVRDYLKNYDFSEEEYGKIEKAMRYVYPKQQLTTFQSKISVTALKDMVSGNTNEVENKSDKEILEIIQKNNSFGKPKFMNELEAPLKKSEIGTLIHLVLQKINFGKDYTMQMLKDEVQEYVEAEIITDKQKDVIDLTKIYNFVHSDFATRIRNSKKIYKEAPFYMNVGIEEISAEAKEHELKEKVLVQGIIDLYFEEKDGRLVILDYKTDTVKAGEEEKLANKHKEQLMMYKNALEQATQKSVKEMYIYSTCLDKVIRIIPN